MKKSIIVIGTIFVLALVGWTGAAYFLGVKIEKQYSEFMEEYRELGMMKISYSDYQRELFTSTTETTVEFVFPQNDTNHKKKPTTETLQLVFNHTIKHGPLTGFLNPSLALVKTQLSQILVDGEIPENADEILELFQPFMRTTISFSGQANIQIKIAAFNKQIEDAIIDWKGLTANIDYSPKTKQFTGDFNMPGTNINIKESDMNWGRFSGQFDLVEELPQLYVGNSNATLDKLELNIVEPQAGISKTVNLNYLQLLSNSAIDNGQLKYSQEIKLAEVVVDDEKFGPGILSMEINNLNALALSEMQQQMMEFQKHAANLNNSNAFIQELEQIYIEMFTQILKGKPEINIQQVSFVTPDGDFNADVHVKLLNFDDASLENPAMILKDLYATANLTVHESLVERIATSIVLSSLEKARKNGELPELSPAEIDNMVAEQVKGQIDFIAQNFLVRQEGQLKAKAALKDGTLTLNGEAQPLF